MRIYSSFGRPIYDLEKFRDECGRGQKKPNHCRFQCEEQEISLPHEAIYWSNQFDVVTGRVSPRLKCSSINGEALIDFSIVYCARYLLHHDESFLIRDHNLIAVLQDTPLHLTSREIRKSFCNFRIKNGYFAIMMTPPLDCISAVNNLLTNAAATFYDLQFHFVICGKFEPERGWRRSVGRRTRTLFQLLEWSFIIAFNCHSRLWSCRVVLQFPSHARSTPKKTKRRNDQNDSRWFSRRAKSKRHWTCAPFLVQLSVHFLQAASP